MKFFLASILLCLTLSVSSQDLNDGQGLVGCWTESSEENTDDFKIYRPCDYKEFPSSRYRFKMILRENNECEWLSLAPNDAHEMKTGTWDYDSEFGELTISQNGGTVLKFKVTSISEESIKTKYN